ncbi:family 4B encapsulin nanocompartment shell protein [Palaeococcus ferrophilus]|uniref:family 4B encapsulin nanocompartment shell protein n=1 Tax=Palaeococcus ferrophilus TaxID=83868 RepID=UPI00064E19E4|nr:family 4B encapsulin nanocompartment shell protein [Palaeococcus ferrophilus]
MDVREILHHIIEELENEGLKPDVILAGPDFLMVAGDALVNVKLRIYEIAELGYDAVVADSSALGLTKRASRRISVDPFLEEIRKKEEEVLGELSFEEE